MTITTRRSAGQRCWMPGFLAGLERKATVVAGALAICTAIPGTPATAALLPELPPLPIQIGQTPQDGFAPVTYRELVLTFSAGEYAEPVQSAVSLSCTENAGVPAPQGTHPDPEQACIELDEARLAFADLPKNPAAVCPTVYDPVTVTIRGAWDGKLVQKRRTFGNACLLAAGTGTVFAEWPFRVH